MSSVGEVTRILQAASGGDREAVNKLFPMVYDELRGRAGRLMANQRAGHTLSATALVHEAYVKLVDQAHVKWDDRLHFFCVAAKAMRHILADHAKGRGRGKRGGGWGQVTLDEAAAVMGNNQAIDFQALHEALGELEGFDAKRSQIVEMRFFGGMTEGEIAEVLGVSRRTVERHWRSARNWLFDRLQAAQA